MMIDFETRLKNKVGELLFNSHFVFDSEYYDLCELMKDTSHPIIPIFQKAIELYTDQRLVMRLLECWELLEPYTYTGSSLIRFIPDKHELYQEEGCIRILVRRNRELLAAWYFNLDPVLYRLEND